MFMSDNGACAEWHEFGFDKQTGTEYHTHVGAELDQMGTTGNLSSLRNRLGKRLLYPIYTL